MSPKKIRVQVSYACDACGATHFDADESLCGKCRYPKLAAIVDRAFELIDNPRNVMFLQLLENYRDRLDELTDEELNVFALLTRADFDLFSAFCTAMLTSNPAFASSSDADELRAMSRVVDRIRALRAKTLS